MYAPDLGPVRLLDIEPIGVIGGVGRIGPRKRRSEARVAGSGLGCKVRGKRVQQGGNLWVQGSRARIAVRDLKAVSIADRRSGATEIDIELERTVASASTVTTAVTGADVRDGKHIGARGKCNSHRQ